MMVRIVQLGVGASLLLALPLQAQNRAGDSVALGSVLQAALRHGAGVRVAREQLNESRGALLSASSAFDQHQSIYLNRGRERTMQPLARPTDFVDVQSDHLEYGVTRDRLLRSGIVISPRLSFSRADLSTTGYQSPSGGLVSLDVTLPLLRGRGGGLARANERAAEHESEASELDLRQSYADEAMRATTAYWRYLAAYQQLDALRLAEARAARLVEETQALIRADERPASDLVQLQATIAAKAAVRVGAEQSLIAARQELGLAMGLPRARFAGLGAPMTPFPALAHADTISPADGALLVQQALALRPDVGASQRRRASAHQLVVGSEQELRSRVDLDLQVGYSGIEAGRQIAQFFSPFYRNVPGANAAIGVSIDLSSQNSAARGTAIRSAAIEASATIAATELVRRTETDVDVAIDGVTHSAAQLVSARDAAALYARALENEHVKFKLGTTTLFDALLAEDALMQATLTEIDAHVRHANALAMLQYLTGTLITDGVGEPTVDVRGLIGGQARRE